MKANLTFEYPSKGHGSKTAYNNFIKGLIKNNIEVDTNSLSKDSDLTHALIPGPVSFIQTFIRKKPLIYALLFHPEELRVVKGGGLMNWVSNYYIRKARVITVCSKFSKDELEKFVNKPISVVSCGVNTTVFKKNKQKRRRFRKKYGISKDELLIYDVGSLNHKKGIDGFLKMANVFKDVKFLWAGRNFPHFKGKYDSKRIIKKYSNVILTGFVEDVSMVHAAGDVLLYPSYFELQGIPVLEAMASENPVVVRDIKVFDDWLMHGKNCLKAKSTSDFKDSLNQLINNKRLFNKLSKNGHETAVKHDLKSVGKKLKRVYELALAKDFKPIYNDYSYE